MVKIKAYKVVCREGQGALEIEVNKLIKEGWCPQGGVSTSEFMYTGEIPNSYKSHTSQAMVLFYEE